MREYRSSELGSCLKAQIAKQLDYHQLSTPDWLQVRFDAGNDHEQACLQAMREKGYNIVDSQLEVELAVAGALVVGHIDGAIRDKSIIVPSVWEAKAPGAWSKFEKAYKTNDWSDPLAHRYSWQASSYMLALNMEMLVCCLTDSGQIRTFGIEKPPFSLDAIEGRVAYMEEMVKLNRLPKDCSQPDNPCPLEFLHHPEELEPDPEIDSLVLERESLRLQAKSATALVKELDAQILSALGERESVETPTSKVTRYTTRRGTIKKETLEAAGLDPELLTTYTTSESVRITAKVVDVEPDPMLDF